MSHEIRLIDESCKSYAARRVRRRHRGQGLAVGGFEVLRDVNRYNAGAFWQELDREIDRMDPCEPGWREGIPVEVWRALPDSPTA